jgi:hypothetical protein
MAHQLLFPLVCEPDENVLARTLQPLAMVLYKPNETVNVVVLFEVNGQYVARGGLSSFLLSVSLSMQRPSIGVKRIET